MDWFCWENFNQETHGFLPWNIMGSSRHPSYAMNWCRFHTYQNHPKSMGDLQDPIDGGTLVPYVWPYFVVIFTYIGLKNRPYIGLRYGIGTSILGSWRSPIDKTPAYVLCLHMFGGSNPIFWPQRPPTDLGKWLSGWWLEYGINLWLSHQIGNGKIIPTDELSPSFFKGVGGEKPPTSYSSTVESPEKIVKSPWIYGDESKSKQKGPQFLGYVEY